MYISLTAGQEKLKNIARGIRSYISYYSHCYYKVHDKNSLRKERVHCASRFEDSVHNGGEGMAAGE